jgi:hypothetical protein
LEFLSEEDVVIGYATDYTTDGDELIPLVIIATQDVNFDGILLNKGVYFYTSNMTLGDTSLPYIYVSSLYLPGETFDDPDITALQKELDKKAPTSHGYHVPTPETADTATFLRNDNTWQKITPDTIGAASSNHGLHVPAKQTADNAKFLRNDNTWQTVTPANIGAAPASHGYHVPAPETADSAKFLRNDNTWQKITPTNIGAVSSAELKQHADSNAHITSDERTKWNTASAFATSHETNHAPHDAKPNQNAFSTVVVGTANITASSETDSFSIVAGEGVSVTGDATNKNVTISHTGVKSVVEGTQNGTISVDGSPVSVHGLGSAAYTSSDSYDASGKADEAYTAAKNYTDGKIALLLDNSSEAVDSILELATAM